MIEVSESSEESEEEVVYVTRRKQKKASKPAPRKKKQQVVYLDSDTESEEVQVEEVSQVNSYGGYDPYGGLRFV